MSANPAWPRWTFATLSQHFAAAAQAAGYPFYVSGDERITQTQESYIEFRMNGPLINEISKDTWIIFCEVNLLIIQKLNLSDFHLIHQMSGVMAGAFANGIAAFQFGDTAGDDASITWGCFVLDKRKNDDIIISQLGQLGPDLSERQNAVQGYYSMYIEL